MNGVPHGRAVRAGQPLVFHCNHYNRWLQNTLRLDPTLQMDDVIVAAAASAARAQIAQAAAEAGLQEPRAVLALARELFRVQGFGTLDLSGLSKGGGTATTPVSHYGQTLFLGADEPPLSAQNLLDRGFAQGAAEAAFGEPFHVVDATCQSLGNAVGTVTLAPGLGEGPRYDAVGVGHHSDESPGPIHDSAIDEPAVLAALATLDLDGNEEGLIPRFGVMLTQHYANFYNRISFEFVRRMRGSGMTEGAEELLTHAGFRCAFHTFGGIMLSDEWNAVVRPMIRSTDDWIHGMVACVNALGWGVWRVHELSADRIVVRIHDDYESAGYRAMYGQADQPVSYLAAGGVAGIMHLVRIGDIHERPTLDAAFYERCFEVDAPFRSHCTRSQAMGAPYTEIVAERS
jgi:predicted hydrocarbon binding protein